MDVTVDSPPETQRSAQPTPSNLAVSRLPSFMPSPGQRKALYVLLGIGLFISPFLIGFSFVPIHGTEVGLRYDSINQMVDMTRIYPPGRHFIGLGNFFIRYPKSLQAIEFNARVGDSGAPRGRIQALSNEGQRINFDCSLQYRVNTTSPPALGQLFSLFDSNFHERIAVIAQNTILDVASSFETPQFFNNRTGISSAIISKLDRELLPMIDVALFQLREISIPTAFEDVCNQSGF